jgi:hypothetical protein
MYRKMKAFRAVETVTRTRRFLGREKSPVTAICIAQARTMLLPVSIACATWFCS